MARAVREDFQRYHVEQEARPIGLSQSLLEIVSGHLCVAATIYDGGVTRAQAPGLRDRINGSVATPNDRHAVAHWHLVQWASVKLFDELEGLDHFRQILARDVQPRAFAKPQPEEQSVELPVEQIQKEFDALFLGLRR